MMNSSNVQRMVEKRRRDQQLMEKFAKYEKYIISLAKKYNPEINFDDCKQECYKKMCEIANANLGGDKNIDNAKFVKVSLTNHVYDLMRRKHTRDEYVDEYTTVDIIFDGFDSEFEHSFGKKFASQYMTSTLSKCFSTLGDSVNINEFRDIVIDWSKYEDEQTQLLIREIVTPSLESQEKWEEMCEKHPYLKHYTHIPFLSYSEILGIPKSKITRVIKNLATYIKDYCGSDILEDMGISKQTLLAYN